jgi:hypothetical protein
MEACPSAADELTSVDTPTKALIGKMALTPTRARVALFTLAIVVLIGLRSVQSIVPSRRSPGEIGDLRLHQLTIETIRSGVSYYDAVGAELRRHQYPTASWFNWRTPLHYKFVAAVSVEWAARIMAVFAMLAVATATVAYARRSWRKGVIAALAVLGAMPPPMIFEANVFFAEAWAGLAIALSLNAYVTGRYAIGAAFGVGAVFLRELAAPYALVFGLLAFFGRRWREFSIWAVGGALYAAYYAVHAMAVSAAIQPGAIAHTESWFRLLGLPFVFKTLYLHGWLIMAPAAYTPIAAAAGLAALAAPSAPLHIRLTLLSYVLFFSVVGQPFNFYWGFLTTAIWAHAFVYSAEGLTTLVRASGLFTGRLVGSLHRNTLPSYRTLYD